MKRLVSQKMFATPRPTSSRIPYRTNWIANSGRIHPRPCLPRSLCLPHASGEWDHLLPARLHPCCSISPYTNPPSNDIAPAVPPGVALFFPSVTDENDPLDGTTGRCHPEVSKTFCTSRDL